MGPHECGHYEPVNRTLTEHSPHPGCGRTPPIRAPRPRHTKSPPRNDQAAHLSRQAGRLVLGKGVGSTFLERLAEPPMSHLGDQQPEGSQHAGSQQAGSQQAGSQQVGGQHRRARSRWKRPPHGLQHGSQQAGSQQAGSQQAGSQQAGSQQQGAQQHAIRARSRWSRPQHGPQHGSQQAGSQQAGSQQAALPNRPAWAPEAAMATTAAATNTGRRIRRFMGDALL